MPLEVQALERGRDANDNRDRDTTNTTAKYEVILQLFVPFFSSPRQQPGSALTFPCVGRVFTIHAGFECASDARHKYGTTMFTITNTAHHVRFSSFPSENGRSAQNGSFWQDTRLSKTV